MNKRYILSNARPFVALLSAVFMFANATVWPQEQNPETTEIETARATVAETLRAVWDPELGEWLSRRATARYTENDAQWHERVLEDTFKSIASELIVAADVPNSFIDLQVSSCPYMFARSDVGGTVTVCIPMALELQTRDEAAFIVAHEIAHVIFDDFGQNTLLEPYLSNSLISSALNTEKLLSKINDATPKDAEMEIRADRLAIDLMVAGGFSIQGALSIVPRLPYDLDSHYVASEERASLILQYAESKYLQYLDSIGQTVWGDDVQKSIKQSDAYLTRAQEVVQIFVISLVDAERFPFINELKADSDGSTREQNEGQACFRAMSLLEEIDADFPAAEMTVHLALATLPYCFLYANMHENNVGYSSTLFTFLKEHAALQTYSMSTLAGLALASSVFEQGLLPDIYSEIERQHADYDIFNDFEYFKDNSVEYFKESRVALNRAQELISVVCKLEGIATMRTRPTFSDPITGYTNNAIAPPIRALQTNIAVSFARQMNRNQKAALQKQRDNLARTLNEGCLETVDIYREAQVKLFDEIRAIGLRESGQRPSEFAIRQAEVRAEYFSKMQFMGDYIADTDIVVLLRRLRRSETNDAVKKD